MGTLDRRNVVKQAVAATVAGAAGFATGRAGGQEPKPESPKVAPPSTGRTPHYELPSVPGDPLLERAMESPFHFMFTDEATFETGPDLLGYDVVFAGSRHPRAGSGGVKLRVASVVVFRADAETVPWKCDSAEGTIAFKPSEMNRTADGKPCGPVVLAVRDGKGAVRCYTLMYDFRC